MKFEVKKSFLLRDDPNVKGRGKNVIPGDIIDITEKRANAVRNLETEGFLQRIHENKK
ncbi:hypothetical protein [Muricomes intestini]|jgi:hypothetical protein|uniref:hypothetical protein n=1 Tax=Muricomes intestini TaxID=1796634 RepID=UPI002FDDFBF4